MKCIQLQYSTCTRKAFRNTSQGMEPSSSPTSTYSEPQVFGDVPMIRSLIDKIDEFQQDVDLDAIERIGEENKILKESIDSYHRIWDATFDLLREAFEAMALLHVSISTYGKVKTDARNQWIVNCRSTNLSS